MFHFRCKIPVNLKSMENCFRQDTGLITQTEDMLILFYIFSSVHLFPFTDEKHDSCLAKIITPVYILCQYKCTKKKTDFAARTSVLPIVKIPVWMKGTCTDL